MRSRPRIPRRARDRRAAQGPGDRARARPARGHAAICSSTSTPTAARRSPGCERIERRFAADPSLSRCRATIASTIGTGGDGLLLRAYDLTLGPATHVLVKYVLRIGVVFYGGNFAVTREALERSAGSIPSIEFHGEDTNLGRRLSRSARVELRYDCLSLHVGAPVQRDGEGRGVPPLRPELRVGACFITAQRIRPTSTCATRFCALSTTVSHRNRHGVRAFYLNRKAR